MKIFLRTAFTFSVFVLLVQSSWLRADEPAALLSGVMLEQTSNGLPGQPQEEPTIQEVSVTPDRLLLIDRATSVNYIFRLDGKTTEIFKVSADRKEFTRGAELAGIQFDRDLAERQRLAMILDEEDSGKREAYLKEEHLRRDGKREVALRYEEVPPAAGGSAAERLGYPVRRLIVTENGRTIVDALIAKEFPIKLPLFDFYRHVGAFSQEVLDQLKGVEGVPLKAEITVVTATLNYKICAEVQRLLVSDAIPAALFELPPNAMEKTESDVVPCANCGQEVERASPGNKWSFQGQNFLFCTKADCARSFRARMLKSTPGK